MKKIFLLLLLPLLAMVFSACSEDYSKEQIESFYVDPINGVLKAEGQDFTIKVASTHSYVLTAQPADACDFVANGVVEFDKEGVAIMEINNLISVKPNTTDKVRLIAITATHRHNQEMQTTIFFHQSAQIETDEE